MKFVGIIVAALIVLGVGVWFLVPKLQPKSQTSLGTSKTIFTLEDLSTHKTAADCWTVIDNNLYDITKFIPMHPGGNIILVACGKDSTSDFKNAGVRGHLTKGIALLAGMKIGSLK